MRVEAAENQLLPFPGCAKPGESSEVREAREDARLLAAIGQGDQPALAALYQRHGTLLYSLLVRMLVNEVEAQEVLQDAFIQIWRRAGKYDPERSSPVAWMIMVARGLALDRLRARARQAAKQLAYHQDLAMLAVEPLDGAQRTARNELAAACAAALQGLPEPQARAIQMAFLCGWTQEEIADAEAQPLGTIKARIRRGLLALRKALKEYHG